MKKKIALLMAIVLLSSTLGGINKTNIAVAQEQLDTTPVLISAPINEYNLTLQDAIKLAKENSREMWKIDDGLRQMQDLRKQGAEDKKDAEDLATKDLASIPASFTTPNAQVKAILDRNDYNLVVATTKTEELKQSKDILNLNIEVSTKSLYYDVLLQEKTIEINTSNLNKAKEQLRILNLKYKNGSVKKTDVLNGEIQLQKAQSELDSSIDELEIVKLGLLSTLGLPFDTQLSLVDTEISYVPTNGINLNEALEKAKAQRPEILKAKNTLEVQKIESKAYSAYYSSNLKEHIAALEKLKDAELNFPKSYRDVELDVRKAYLNLLKAERAYLNAEKTLELAKESARITKLLFDKGMAASVDLIGANATLSQAEINRLRLLSAYDLSKFMFDNSNLLASK